MFCEQWRATGPHANTKCSHNKFSQARIWLISQQGVREGHVREGSQTLSSPAIGQDPLPATHCSHPRYQVQVSGRLEPTSPHVSGNPHSLGIWRGTVRAD